MKTLSEGSRILIGTLLGKPEFINRIHHPKWNREVIAKLGESGEPAAIPYLVPALASSDRSVVLTAAQAIKSLMVVVAVEGLVLLDEWMRNSWYGADWKRLEPRELSKWVGPGEPGILLLQLSSMHSNGYVREAAVRRLSLINDGSELPFLLLRLNDWVAQVRKSAQDAILNRVQPNYAAGFILNLALVIRLEETRRNDHKLIMGSITQLLAGHDVRAPMLDAMHNPSSTIRRGSFRILCSVESHALPQVLSVALTANDALIRLRAARIAASHLERGSLRTFVVMMLGDASAAVRLEGLRAMLAAFPEDAPEFLWTAVLDGNAAMRSEARFHLAKGGKRDFRAIYKKSLETTKASILLAAIAGIAETGVPDDAESLIPFLSHRLARVRKTAVRFLLKLGGDRYVDLVMDRVLDTSPGVSKQACQILVRHPSRGDATKLWPMFRGSTLVHIRQNVVLLLAALPKWESITYLLLASDDDDESVATLARDHIANWDVQFNRIQATPTSEQLARIENALAQVKSVIPASILASIRFSLNEGRAK